MSAPLEPPGLDGSFELRPRSIPEPPATWSLERVDHEAQLDPSRRRRDGGQDGSRGATGASKGPPETRWAPATRSRLVAARPTST